MSKLFVHACLTDNLIRKYNFVDMSSKNASAFQNEACNRFFCSSVPFKKKKII